jgi:hypothetical protein
MAQLNELEPIQIEVERFVKQQILERNISVRTKPDVVAQRYIDAIVGNVVKYLAYRTPEDMKLGTYKVSLDTISREVGRYGSRGKQIYWFPLLHKNFPLFRVVKQGAMIRGVNKHGSLTQIKMIY